MWFVLLPVLKVTFLNFSFIVVIYNFSLPIKLFFIGSETTGGASETTGVFALPNWP